MENKHFLIGNFSFSLSYPSDLRLPFHFQIFETANRDEEFSYKILRTGLLPATKGKPIAVRPDLCVFEKNGLEQRLIGVKGIDGYYALYQETSERSADVYLQIGALGISEFDPMFVSLLALERRIVHHDALILHCAYIRYKDEAILFSAPSETGKTTQANLWEKYRHSETINGDKSLLQKIDGRWVAQGWPVCGSSDVCHNESTPIRAIVMLSQDKINHVERLKGMAAFTQLYSQITVNSWNRDFVNHNMDLIEQLITDVPVYHLGCTISEEAVSCLANALYDPGKNMQADTEARS